MKDLEERAGTSSCTNFLTEITAEWIIGLPNKYFFSQQTKSKGQTIDCDKLVSYPKMSDGLNKVNTADIPKDTLEDYSNYEVDNLD